METGTNAAVAFLERLYPNGLWSLTAIQPDRKAIETRTFTADQADAARVWIAKFNGKRNVYFSANQPNGIIRKKAEKTDIAFATVLHVDLDCRAGEPLDAELDRLRRLVVDAEGWPDRLPRPNVSVFSGGGYQCFFVLAEPVAINGDVAAAEEFERYNRGIELLLGGDNCHNVDRICRLPGTVNVPDEKKRKKGRVAVQAELIHFDDGAYDLAPFDDLRAPPKNASAGPETPAIRRTLARVEKLDDLNVPAALKTIIAQGALPAEERTEKQQGFSRSHWTFFAVCELIRQGVPDDTIYALVTDPGWGISAHVLAQKNVDRYARRQLERARAEVEKPELRELNDKHFVVGDFGGKCLVLQEVYDDLASRYRLSKQSFDQFRNRYMNRLVQAGQKSDGTPVVRPLGRWWLEHSMRREFERVVFAPGRDVGDDEYNLWRGFAVEPKEGDCSKFLAHVRDNICAENAVLYDWVIGWMALAVQKPAQQGHAAIVLRGRQGTGKSFFARAFGQLFGRHYLQVADAKHLVGNFNAHLRDCVVLFGDEAFYAGDKRHEGVLKTLVTEPALQYEPKGVDAEQGPNFVHLIMASNDAWVVPADMDDRRFLVLDVSEEHARDTKYFGDIAKELANGGREALLHMLLHYDLAAAGFNVRDVPGTAAKDEQKLYSASDVQRAVYAMLLEGDAGALAVRGRDVFVASEALRRRHELPARQQTALGRELARCTEGAKSERLAAASEKTTQAYRHWVGGGGNVQPRGYWLPSLHQARSLWAELRGLEIGWGGDKRIDWDEVEAAGGDDDSGIPF